ncbi:hypothetical protein QBZ16_004379 [Prototheca wickerhamii]|uniref:Uncharacterized protein n=1 Tax=Prototheca wickerhamii TaxID=3111 RepID=A0AAD9MGU4_PROWI|nr:hypothetical protein QBZ16_004379 [Prototheca wickerhamii]
MFAGPARAPRRCARPRVLGSLDPGAVPPGEVGVVAEYVLPSLSLLPRVRSRAVRAEHAAGLAALGLAGQAFLQAGGEGAAPGARPGRVGALRELLAGAAAEVLGAGGVQSAAQHAAQEPYGALPAAAPKLALLGTLGDLAAVLGPRETADALLPPLLALFAANAARGAAAREPLRALLAGLPAATGGLGPEGTAGLVLPFLERIAVDGGWRAAPGAKAADEAGSDAVLAEALGALAALTQRGLLRRRPLLALVARICQGPGRGGAGGRHARLGAQRRGPLPAPALPLHRRARGHAGPARGRRAPACARRARGAAGPAHRALVRLRAQRPARPGQPGAGAAARPRHAVSVPGPHTSEPATELGGAPSPGALAPAQSLASSLLVTPRLPSQLLRMSSLSLEDVTLSMPRSQTRLPRHHGRGPSAPGLSRSALQTAIHAAPAAAQASRGAASVHAGALGGARGPGRRAGAALGAGLARSALSASAGSLAAPVTSYSVDVDPAFLQPDRSFFSAALQQTALFEDSVATACGADGGAMSKGPSQDDDDVGEAPSTPASPLASPARPRSPTLSAASFSRRPSAASLLVSRAKRVNRLADPVTSALALGAAEGAMPGEAPEPAVAGLQGAMHAALTTELSMQSMTAMESTWAPAGALVAHLPEHQGAVTALAAATTGLFFVSTSEDGTAKVWDGRRLDRETLFRSRLTYAGHQAGKSSPAPSIGSVFAAANPVTAAAALPGGAGTVVTGAEDGGVHAWRVERTASASAARHRRASASAAALSGVTVLRRRDAEGPGPGATLCLLPWGPQAALQSHARRGLSAWDLRAPDLAWQLPFDPGQGTLCAVAAPPELGWDGGAGRDWVLTGSSRGVVTVWDLRFRLPVLSWRLAGEAPVDALALASPAVALAAAGGEAASPAGSPTSSVSAASACVPHVFVAAGDGEVGLWDVGEGRPRRVMICARDAAAAGGGSSASLAARSAHLRASAPCSPLAPALSTPRALGVPSLAGPRARRRACARCWPRPAACSAPAATASSAAGTARPAPAAPTSCPGRSTPRARPRRTPPSATRTVRSAWSRAAAPCRSWRSACRARSRTRRRPPTARRPAASWTRRRRSTTSRPSRPWRGWMCPTARTAPAPCSSRPRPTASSRPGNKW